MLQFSDVLFYGSRLPPPKLQFKVHAQLALHNIDVSTHAVCDCQSAWNVSSQRACVLPQMFFLFISFFCHEIFELPQPLIGRWVCFITQIQKFVGLCSKIFWGPKHAKFGAIYFGLQTLIAYIFEDIQSRTNRLRFLLCLANNVWRTLVH